MSNQYRALASLALANALASYRQPSLTHLYRPSLANVRYFRSRVVLPVQAMRLP